MGTRIAGTLASVEPRPRRSAAARRRECRNCTIVICFFISGVEKTGKIKKSLLVSTQQDGLIAAVTQHRDGTEKEERSSFRRKLYYHANNGVIIKIVAQLCS